jgi:hypothetical protein
MTPEDRPEIPETGQTAASATDSRRRLLRGGLASAPVLLTFVNRPVMAATCQTASVFGSASLSRPDLKLLPPCEGVGPQRWSADGAATDWPAPMAIPDTVKTIEMPVAAGAQGSTADRIAAPSTLNDGAPGKPTTKTVKVSGTTFNSVFGNQGGYGSKTLSEVLQMNTNSGRDGLARHLVAAYLNALKGLTPREVLDVPTIKSIWTSFIARGYYEPTAGIRWFPDYAEPASPRGGLIAWLKTTMPR